jgi:hypothetical protein
LLNTGSTNGQQNNTFLDSSTNNFTITRNGTPTQGSITPYWPNGQWSNYFNGSTDYLSATNATTVFQFGSNPYTIEGWVYQAARPGRQWLFGGVFSNPSYQAAINASGFIFGSVTGIGDLPAATIAVPLNAWTHFAIVRTSTSSSGGAYYINGVPAGTFTDSSNISGTTTTLNVGTTNNNTSVSPLNGYLSNFRIVKGVAVYTGVFTPSTVPLAATQSAGTNIAAITGTQTAILTCQSNRFRDNSAQVTPATLTPTGTPTVQAFQPFSPTASYTTALYGGSGYFPSSGSSYLNSTITALSNTFVVMECWVYNNSLDNSAGNHYLQMGAASYVLAHNNNGQARFLSRNDGGGDIFDIISASGVLKLNQWQYVVGIRNATTASLYVDGTRVGTLSVSTSSTSATALYVSGNAGATRLLDGYMANARIISGSLPSGYDPTSTTIAVPTTPLTAVANTRFLLNFTNAGIYDAAAQNNLITVGEVQTSITPTPKFGVTTSIKFDPATNLDYLNILPVPPSLALGTSNFTIEGWIYLNTVTGAQTIFDQRPASTNGAYPVLYMNGATMIWYVNSAAQITSGSLSTLTWYYFAITRSTSVTRMYIDGAQVGSNYSDTNNYLASKTLIGVTNDIASGLNGNLQEFRITRGVARTVTTVPTAPFPTR